jgi:hypothetical protein
MENDKNAKNFAGLNIGGVIGDHGTVTINKLEVVQGNKITILRTDNSRTEIEVSDPFYGAFEETDSKGKSPEVITKVDEIRTEANKGDNANPSFIQQRLINLAKMAPDIFGVVVATLVNPLNGFALAVQKIAQKAKEEYK